MSFHVFNAQSAGKSCRRKQGPPDFPRLSNGLWALYRKQSEEKRLLDATLLAAHYGFMDEELDFIINYDIKYRMGRDAETGEE